MMADINSGRATKAVLSVPGMVCDGCAERIGAILTPIPGVLQVKTRLWRKQVQISFQVAEIDVDALVAALDQAGSMPNRSDPRALDVSALRRLGIGSSRIGCIVSGSVRTT
ncbi:hypothetical protein A3753_17840 [Sulfitobacter sp. HI0082]|nr:hypothetical protein A3753_17840 [Sulfitobacter sp. HI0082]